MQHLSSCKSGQRFEKNPSARFRLAILTVFLWLTAVLGWLIPLSAQAQTTSPNPTTGTSNVKLQARSFYGGYFKYGDWLPVEISLENYGEAIEAQVETTVTSYYNGANLNTAFRRVVSLGQRANKRFTLYLQPYVQSTNVSRSLSYEAKVQLKSGERVLDEKTIKLQPIPPQDYILGAIVTDPNVLVSMNNLKVGPLRSSVVAAPLTLADIPDRAEGLRSLNALVISEIATDGLKAEQRTAIKNWVGAGGQLLLMGGSGWGRVREAFDSSFLPFDVLDFTNVSDIGGLSAVPGEKAILSRPVALARGQILQGGRALAYASTNTGPTPLMAERKVGAGRVIALALDLTNPTVMDWTGSKRLWQELFSYNAGVNNALYQEQNPHLKNAVDLLGFISNVPELQLPNLWPFLLLFGIYIIVVSPLNYLILKRLGRLELAWLTIPATIALCTGVTLFIAGSQQPGQVIVSQMSVIQLGSDQEAAQLRSYAAVFSPEERRYQVAPEEQEGTTNILLSPMSRASNGAANDVESLRVVVQGEKARMDSFPIGQWAAQGFSTETVLPARNFQIYSSLYFKRENPQSDNAKIVGTIRNTTASTLRNVMLVMGDAPTKLKDAIEPGEAVEVNFSLPSPTAAVPAFCSTTYGNYGLPPQTVGDRISTLLQQDRRDDKLLSNRAGFVKKVFDSGRYSPLNLTRGLDIVAWPDQNPLPLDVDGVTVQTKASQLLIARLPINAESRDGGPKCSCPARLSGRKVSAMKLVFRPSPVEQTVRTRFVSARVQ